jgi:predicted TIM-barrel fold metal-dependent hydrolase
MLSFENALKANPKTTFIACHYLNMNHDLERLGKLLDKYPNLYIDIAGRMGESAVTPRTTRAFLIKYADRVLFGTDNGMNASMYRHMFRILETDDEHFYIQDYGYHWSYSGLHLPKKVLKKIYYENAKKLFR